MMWATYNFIFEADPEYSLCNIGGNGLMTQHIFLAYWVDTFKNAYSLRCVNLMMLCTFSAI